LVRAESAGIELRSSEKFGPAVLEFRNYLGDAARLQDAQKALESGDDVSWCHDLLAEVSIFESTPVFSIEQFATICPLMSDHLKTEAEKVRLPVLEYLEKKYGNLDAFVAYWRNFLKRTLDGREVVSLFRDSRRLPSEPDVLIRYQSGLDNELYKAMRALREAQTYRLSTIDVVPGRDGGGPKGKA
jgi:hypothetical protein